MRKFEVTKVEFSPGLTGPHAWNVHYKAIRNKKWVTGTLGIVAQNAEAAREQAISRFDLKN